MSNPFDSAKDEVRRRADIVDLVGQRVALKRAGKNWKGLCPFHDDRNPSFIVSAEFGSYRCWSCGAKGDVFNWVMETQRVEFPEALRILANEYGIKLPEFQKGEPDTRLNLQGAMDRAQSFFTEELARSPQAKEYLSNRKIDPEIIKKWGLGYAPDIGEALAVNLKKSGLSLADCALAFLVKQDASGGYMDQFRGRIMFPIHDERGKLVAFGGRVLGDGIPKYINSSDTPIYNKSRVLYGMHLAKDHISQSDCAVLVEGYLDVIACHRAGIQNAVASLGTALTDDQVRLLGRWCPKIVILYDSDVAGIKAAERAAEIIQSHKLTVRIASVPEGGDPDTLLAKKGAAALKKIVDESVSLLEFRIAGLNKRPKPSDDAYWAEVVKVLASAENDLELKRFLLPIAAEYPGLSDRSAATAALQRMVEREIKGQTPFPKADSDVRKQSPSHTPAISTPELHIMLGFLRPDTRELAVRAIIARELWQGSKFEHISDIIAQACKDEIPAGELKIWSHGLNDEGTINLLFHLTTIGETVSEETLRMAIDRLTEMRDRRDARGSLESLEDDALRAYNEKLRSLKGNF